MDCVNPAVLRRSILQCAYHFATDVAFVANIFVSRFISFNSRVLSVSNLRHCMCEGGLD